MRVALVGYGAVAAIHARVLRDRAQLVSVYGPERAKAKTFARLQDIPHVDTELAAAIKRSDVVIICSPSPFHFQQALQAVTNGTHTLIELPAVASTDEALELERMATTQSVVIQCAHTSRYLEPYRRITEWIQQGLLGELRHLHYVRNIVPRERSWKDDALLHHAEHPLDLFLHWFGAVRALGCAAHPGIPGAQDVSLLATVLGETPVSVSVSYSSRLSDVKMTLVGTQHTVATDGFSYIAADDPNLAWQGDELQVYGQAIERQDAAFLCACAGGQCGVPWQETIRLTNCVSEFVKLWNRQ